jgi:serine protease AprX
VRAKIGASANSKAKGARVMSRRLQLAFAFLLSLFASIAFAADSTLSGLKRLALSPPNALGSYDGVATFGGAMPSSAQLDSLRGLGLTVQGFRNLPLAMVRGPKQAMFDAVTRGVAADVYPNEKLKFFSVSSDFSIRANEVHATGINGAGVTVAVVDSGIDARHPDLANRVVRNYKMVDVGTVAAGVAAPPIVARVDQGPFNNSDTSSGHGTHVAGIIAADNTDGKVLGVAPGAKLVGYGTGEAVFVFNVLTAFDDIISAGDIRVVNNSWGSSFRLFNPDEPINQATLAMYGAGIVVTFAAGNASTEMSLNPYSAAPWVISVGNGTLAHQRNTTSSGGIEFDNAFLTLLPATDEKHLVFSGDRIGLYHPSVSAPGTDIVSTATNGLLVTSLPGGTASASGTSMASPHIAGVAALMLQKNPKLSPAEVKSAMQVTSDPMPSLADTKKVEAFYLQGYGFVNAKAAVDLVGRNRYSKDKALARLQATADAKILADRDYKVIGTDYWSFTAAPATVNGTPDTRTYTLQVSSATKAIKALVSYPSLGYVGANPFDYQLTLVDAAGKTVGTSTPAGDAGMSQFFVDLGAGSYTYGTWTLNVVGNLGAQDQDTLMGVLVSVALHQLAPQARVAQTLPKYTPGGTASYYFQPGAAGLASSSEGCNQQAGAPVGGFSTTRNSAGSCQSGNMGYLVNYGAAGIAGGTPASFTTAKLTAPITLGGPATMKFYLVDPLQPAWQAAQAPFIEIEIDAIDDNGDLVLAVAASQQQVCETVNGTFTCKTGPTPVGGTYTFDIPPVTIPAGTRLSVLVRAAQVVTSTARTVYGGRGLTADYSDAGITFTTGTLQ